MFMKTSVKRLLLILLPLFVVILTLQSCSGSSDAVTPSVTSLEMKVTFSPIAVKSTDGKINLLYSVETPNFEKEGYGLKDFQVLNAADNTILCSIKDKGKYMLIHNPTIESIPQELYYYPLLDLAAYRFSIGLILDPVEVPQKVKHKLVLIKDATEKIIEGAEASISKGPIIVISAPLKGGGFVAASTTTLMNNHHPTYQLTYRGMTTVPERYCVDWNKLDSTGSPFQGDQSICENWYVYGQNVYAASSGQIVSVSDGMPDQFPVGTVSSDVNIFNGAGNSVVIVSEGGYTIYGHLKPNSIVVKIGQIVKKGQLIGNVGNSGNSQAPHLHFGLHTDFPYYISESLPYYIDSMEKIGSTGKQDGPLVMLMEPELHTNELVENYGVYNLK
jgi:hypothetical protein